MRRPLAFFLSVVLIGLGAYAAPAQADVTCTGGIGAAEIDDDVVVPGGESCSLDGTRVDGNVKVSSGATLTAREVRVEGNIQAERHAGAAVSSSFVDGDIQLFDGGRGRVARTEIGGNLQVEDATASQEAVSNDIDGDLQAFENSGGFHILSNRIGGNLQCKSNEPPPHGGGNAVEGDKEDQCANLESTSQPPSPPPPDGTPETTEPILGAGIVTGPRMRRVIGVVAACDVSCRARVSGSVVVRLGFNRIVIGLRPARMALRAGERGAFKLMASSRKVRFTRAAIRDPRGGARLVVRVAAADRSGGLSVVRRGAALRG